MQTQQCATEEQCFDWYQRCGRNDVEEHPMHVPLKVISKHCGRRHGNLHIFCQSPKVNKAYKK